MASSHRLISNYFLLKMQQNIVGRPAVEGMIIFVHTMLVDIDTRVSLPVAKFFFFACILIRCFSFYIALNKDKYFC